MSKRLQLITLAGLVLSLAAFAAKQPDSYRWLWKDRKASADALRALGRNLAIAGDNDDAVLAEWGAFSADFGMSVFTPSIFDISEHPGRYFVEGTRYLIDSDDVSKAGWRLRCPWVDWEATEEVGNFVSIDFEGAFISASQPGVWFIGQRGVSQQQPEQDKLQETVVAISQGNGRLILVDLSGKSGVAILPYGVK